MIKKVKIRDMSETQLDGACVHNCEKCPFSIATRDSHLPYCALVIKDRNGTLSDKILDHEVEVEVPDILTKEEKEWLRKTVEMALFKVVSIEVCIYQYKFIYVNYENKDKSKCAICFPAKDGWFKGMEEGRRYTLEDLGL